MLLQFCGNTTSWQNHRKKVNSMCVQSSFFAFCINSPQKLLVNNPMFYITCANVHFSPYQTLLPVVFSLVFLFPFFFSHVPSLPYTSPIVLRSVAAVCTVRPAYCLPFSLRKNRKNTRNCMGGSKVAN